MIAPITKITLDRDCVVIVRNRSFKNTRSPRSALLEKLNTLVAREVNHPNPSRRPRLTLERGGWEVEW